MAGSAADATADTTPRDQALAALEEALSTKPQASSEPPTAPAEPAAAAAPATPATPEDPVLPDPAQAELARRVQELVRLESESLRRDQESKTAVAAAQAELARERAAREDMLRQLRENPMELLTKHQWDLESLVKAQASSMTPEAVRAARVEREMAELKAELAKRDEAAKAATAEAARSQALMQLKTQLIPAQLKAVESELPTLRAWMGEPELVEAVYDLMGREYRRTNGASTLEPQEAARQLESALRARVQRLPGAPVTAPASQPSSKPNPNVGPSATLTNQHTQHTPNPHTVDPTNEAALRRAALQELTAMFSQQ